MTTPYKLYKAALSWREKGYNVVPQNIKGEKFPAVKWKHLQGELVTPHDLWRWMPLFTCGIGFITGEISGTIVVETDGLHGQTMLDIFDTQCCRIPRTLVVQSGSRRGFHYHFKHPGQRVKTQANPCIKLDIKGDGGFCLLPPSRHRSGLTYDVIVDAPPAPLPEGLIEFIQERAARQSSKKTPISRNHNARS